MKLWLLIVCLSTKLATGLGQTPAVSDARNQRFDYEYKVLQKLIQLEERQKELVKTVETQQEQIMTLGYGGNGGARTAKTMGKMQDRGHGSTYIRWGRTDCPGNGTELVYRGYAGGSLYSHTGAAANQLCLPREPLWGKFNSGTSDQGMVYGIEYRGGGSLFTSVKTHDDMPCVACRSPRPSVLMIPARNACYGNWTLEYHGYLMSGHFSHNAAADYVCVDAQPKASVGGAASQDGKFLYQVEARCGSLKCPPYVNGRELTCVVCTK